MTEQKWTAADMSDEQVDAVERCVGVVNDEWDEVTPEELIAAAANVMGVQKPAASEWPADAPEWADKLEMDHDGKMWLYGEGAAAYYGPRPASWAGKPWQECVVIRPTVAAQAVDVSSAFAALKQAMQSDSSLAWAWHCNVAVSFSDEGGGHKQANLAAARFMRLAFDVDVTAFDEWGAFQKIWRQDRQEQPAVDVERLAGAIREAVAPWCDADDRDENAELSTEEVIAKVLRRELKGWAS